VRPPLPHVDGVEHREVLVRGVRLHVALAGPEEGRPVVLQHGFPQHWYEWRHLIGPLAGVGYRVVAPDFRGLGWSEHPPDEDFRMETLTDELVALCGSLGYDRVAYVGHDWGAYVGWLLCLNRPDFVARAVLLSVPPPFPPERIEPGALARLGKLWYQLPIVSPLPAAAKLRFFQQMFVVGRASDWEPGVLDEYLGTLRQPAQVRAGTLIYRQFLTRELPGLLGRRYADARLTVPVRFLIGTGDLFYEDDLVDQARPHADADYAGEAVPDAKHFLPEEAPDLVRERALQFLAE
jgi:pimeloyl-ACP methyl ester carboxylesterase